MTWKSGIFDWYSKISQCYEAYLKSIPTWFRNKAVTFFLSFKHGNTNDKNTSSFNKFPQKYFLLAVLYLSVKGNQLTSTVTNKKNQI
jgi:hypothetical protein